MCLSVCTNEKRGRRVHDDECSEIIILIGVMMFAQQTGPDDKNTGKQPRPPIDVRLPTV